MDNQSLDNLKDMIQQCIGTIHTAFPGKISSFDSGKCIASVVPTMAMHLADGRTLDYPTITGVPVFMPHAGNSQITYPVKAGDSCWIVCAERSIDDWLGKGSGNHDPRTYDMTDAVCFVGMLPAQSISPDNIELLNGSTSVSVTPNGSVNIKGNVNIQGNITCTGTSEISGTITCHGDVKASGISLQNHIHGGVESGGSSTSGPR